MENNIKKKIKSFRFNKIMNFIFDYGNDLYCILDEDLRFLWINNKPHKRILGYHINIIRGKRITDFIYEYDNNSFLNLIENNFIDEKEIMIRFYDIRKKVKWFTIWILPYEDEERNQRYILILNDITDEKERKEKLILSEKKFYQLFEESPFIIIILNKRGIIVDFNKRTELYGYTSIDLLGKNFIELRDIIPEKYLPLVISSFRNIIENGRVKPIEIQLYDGNKNLIYAHLEAMIVNIEYEEFVQVIIQDINEKKKAELKLKESEEKYRKIVESVIESYFELDIKGNFTYVNKVLTRNLGYQKREEIIGKNFRDFFDKKNSEYLKKIFSSLYRKEKVFADYKGTWTRGDGFEIAFEGFASLRYDENHKEIGFYGLARNIN